MRNAHFRLWCLRHVCNRAWLSDRSVCGEVGEVHSVNTVVKQYRIGVKHRDWGEAQQVYCHADNTATCQYDVMKLNDRELRSGGLACHCCAAR